MLAQARQIHHEGVFELAVHRLLHVVEVLIFGAFFKLAAEDFFPVRTAGDLVHPLAGDQRARTGDRLMFALRRVMQILVVIIKRLVVIIDARQMRVGEDFPNSIARLPMRGCSLPLILRIQPPFHFLVFPVVRETDARLTFHVVEPGVFHPFTAGPDVLQVTEQVWQPMHLSRFSTMPTCERIFILRSPVRSLPSPSNQLMFFILRTTTNSSRLEPTVP